MPARRTDTARSPLSAATCLAGALAAMLAGAVTAGPLSDGYQARYAVSRSGLPLGDSVRVLQPTGPDGWTLAARSEPTGLAAVLFDDVIEEHSELARRDGRIVPLSYSYDQHGGRKDKAYALRFDWQAHRLHLLHSGQTLPLPPGTQDPLGFVVALMSRLKTGATAFSMPIAGRKKIRDYRVEITDHTDMDTVLGRQPVTAVLAREVGRDTRYELWTLPELDYLPLRIRQVRGSQTTELRLRTLATPPLAPASPPRTAP